MGLRGLGGCQGWELEASAFFSGRAWQDPRLTGEAKVEDDVAQGYFGNGGGGGGGGRATGIAAFDMGHAITEPQVCNNNNNNNNGGNDNLYRILVIINNHWSLPQGARVRLRPCVCRA